MIKYAWVALLLAAISLTSCDGCGPVTFTEKERALIPDQKKGDTLEFKSNKGVTSKLYVLSKTLNEVKHKRMGSLMKGTYCNALGEIMYTDVVGFSKIVFSAQVTKSDTEPYTSGFGGAFLLNKYVPVNNTVLHPIYVIKGKAYQNVYEIVADTTDNTAQGNVVYKVFYAQEEGIVRYDNTKGAYWERIN
ncbi:hypothetical protein [Pontibacter harenae]|uniref:hypothetical protein n=1 Tax=Pontibacter harenae TaxID=2894083 RepID=UPI001E644A08|nr:hypothetical protein [Pontibacter harenae]MCC9166789.1 hypothetical protein [Pontibacter harenae]